MSFSLLGSQVLNVDGIQLAKPLSVRTLRELVSPSQKTNLGTAHDRWMNVWPRPLSEYYCCLLI
jgi:hypothetical protein